jgi:hypothetical protein
MLLQRTHAIKFELAPLYLEAQGSSAVQLYRLLRDAHFVMYAPTEPGGNASLTEAFFVRADTRRRFANGWDHTDIVALRS